MNTERTTTRPIDAGVLWLVAREPGEHLDVAMAALEADPEFDELVARALEGDRTVLAELLAGAVIVSHRVLLEGIEAVIELERDVTAIPPPARARRRWRRRRR